jgi:von Willebrand factor type A domain
MRQYLAYAFVATLAACGGPKQFGSICDDPNKPEACDQQCDPTPGAAASCPSGFYCSEDGRCDAECTPSGGQCGDGYTCTDGRCEIDGQNPGPSGPDASCPAVNFTATAVTPSIQLLIDRSGSMADSIGGTSRYTAIRNALVDATNGVITKLQAKAYFGASLYSTDSPCPKLYSVGRALNNRDNIANLINGQSPNGNTPTGPSIDQAVAAFAGNPPPAGSPPIIVLATDGLPNECNSNDTTVGQAKSITAAKAAYAAGIKLFILAVGNGINDAHLQGMANAGAGVQAGMPNAPFYISNTPQDLTTAFNAIIGGVISCDLMISGSVDPGQAANGTVLLNGNPLVYGTDWVLVGGNVIRLQGAACDTLKNSTNPVVTASFPCGTVIL